MFGAVSPLASAEDDEPAEGEWPSTIHRQPVEQAPFPESMPVGSRFAHAELQAYHCRYTLQDDNWWMGMSQALRGSMSRPGAAP
jgi:hypothetical protein